MKVYIKIILFLFCLCPALMLIGQLGISHLTCEYHVNPIGIDIQQPRLSWKLTVGESDMGILQTAYHIQAARKMEDLEKSRNLVWDTGIQNTEQSIQIEYAGEEVTSGDRIYWRVKVWDNQNRESPWSQISFWEMGLLTPDDWKAQWISPDLVEKEKEHNPAPMLRNEFDLARNIRKARLYISSHGMYEAYINGTRVGDQLFTPGWTSYSNRVQYQTYDVTGLLKRGSNATGIRLGDGWYRGKFGFANNWNIYGKETALIFQLIVEYNNGRVDYILSDENWQSSTGAVKYSNIYDGELYDARLEKMGWAEAGFNAGDWHKVVTKTHSKGRLIAPAGVPVKRIEEIPVVDVIHTPAGETVLDFGQNLVGWVKFTVNGSAGERVILLHAEVLDKSNNFYTENLRSADQKIEYILKGGGQEIFEPHFTFQGFRFVRVVDYPGDIDPENFTAVVIHSEMEETGTFECSNPLINQLQSNIKWGQKGNFLDVPTDCPQRDERMGWTGDAQAFAPTACFNFHTAAFYTKWLADLKADQTENGSVPFVVPNVLGQGATGSTGWGDAATIVPWTVFIKYADQRILEDQYESMMNWVNFLHDLAGDDLIVNDGFHFGDWLFFIHPTDWNAKPGYTDIDFLATAFFVHSTDILIKTAKVLGRDEDVEKYQSLVNRIKQVFQNEFLSPSGRLSSHTQTAYTLALAFDLLPENQREKAFEYLVKNIERRNYHLATGFLGTPHLCHVLTRYGRTDLAYKLLTQKSYPSWLYPVTQGATTIWERWDGIKPDSSFQDIRMNSFNHYAYGAIGDWMYEVVSGIRSDENRPGYKHIIIKPEVDTSFTFARASVVSPYGQIRSAWNTLEDSLFLELEIPPNTTASVYLPESTSEDPVKIGSGKHRFSVVMTTAKIIKNLDLDSPLGDLWEHDQVRQWLYDIFPEMRQASDDQIQMGFGLSLKEISDFYPEVFTKARLDAFAKKLVEEK